MREPRYRRICCSVWSSKLTPENQISLFISTRAANGNNCIIANAVSVFPLPDSPTKPKQLDFSMLKLTCETTRFNSFFTGNATVRFLMLTKLMLQFLFGFVDLMHLSQHQKINLQISPEET